MWFSKTKAAVASTGDGTSRDHVLDTTLRFMMAKLERMDGELKELLKQKQAKPPNRQSVIAELLPILDRFQEMAIIAQGHPEIAREFGLTSRQQANNQYTEPEPDSQVDDDFPEGGLVYGST